MFLGIFKKYRQQSSSFVRNFILSTPKCFKFLNKNPRNLEALRCSPKTKGWEFQFPRKDYYYKCLFIRSKYHTTGQVMHRDGSIVVSASTQESVINKRLYSCIDVSAAKNIGIILAKRLHECGIDEILFDFDEQSKTNESVSEFTQALLRNGISLEESPVFKQPEPIGIDYDSLTDEEKRSLYPSLIEELRTTPDWGNFTYPYSLRPVGNGKKRKSNKHQILTKVRQGMVWDPFYNRMLKPEQIPSWRTELETQRIISAEEEIKEYKKLENFDSNEEPTPQLLVPNRWKIFHDF